MNVHINGEGMFLENSGLPTVKPLTLSCWVSRICCWPWSASRSWWIIVITFMLMCSKRDLTLTFLTDIWRKMCPDKVLYNKWPQILWFKRNNHLFSLRAAVQKSEQVWIGSVLRVSQGWNQGFMRGYILEIFLPLWAVDYMTILRTVL